VKTNLRMSKQLEYHYHTKLAFSDSVSSHSFLLRCTPVENEYQTHIRSECRINPAGNAVRAVDCFGNCVLYGFANEPHNSFEFESIGTVLLSGKYRLKEPLSRIFLYPSVYTAPDRGIKDLLNSAKLNITESITSKVVKLTDIVYSKMKYAPNSTTTNTSAAEALKAGKGVCQDFSHILISLCRSAGIAARYAAGFMEGEGSTHAWVEYYDDGCWLAADPTHNRLVESGYIKLSHGRDFDDCSIERGLFSGLATQDLQIHLSVH